MPNECCSELPWDTSFFGVRCAKYRSSRLSEESARAALEFCRERDIECLYLLLSDDPITNATCESYGLPCVDTRLTLSRPLTDFSAPEVSNVRCAKPEDLPELREIARTSHCNSRFYADPNFERSRCAALYEIWIERSLAGWADRTFVADYRGRPSGYITCHAAEREAGSIGLFAVAEAGRGRGLGKALITAALNYFRDAKLRSAEVATQARNIGAQRTYEGCGFTLQSSQRWFHWWFSRKGIV